MPSKTPKPVEAEYIPSPENEREKNPHTLGWITIFVIFGLLGIWAAFSQIETTVKAGGKVISKGYKKAVQHPKGGVVTKLFVHEGDLVKKGQPLLQLDKAEAESRLENSISQYDDLLLEKARLEAESSLKNQADFEKYWPKIMRKEKADTLIAKEKALFQSHWRKLQDQIKLLQDKISILSIQNQGLEEQISSDQKQLESYQKELKKWRSLYEKKMTDELKLLQRERQVEQIRARIAQSKSKIRENKATMESYRNQIALQKTDFVNQARQKLQEVNLKLAMLGSQIRALRNRVKRTTITAPDSGSIVGMEIHGSGEVVIPNKPIAFIVPQNSKLILEVYISPTDIDKVHVGQKADIHFPSYVDPTAKPMEGVVTYLSADVLQPRGSKHPFYKALIELTPKGMKALKENHFEIVPGMPVSVFIKAGKRSFLSYVLSPLEQFARGAFHAN